ncbi:hypothetical protein KKG24_03835 [Patescibacteria group bacterium]|nr:hypothetical protein [Patescibacteria group bacterium]
MEKNIYELIWQISIYIIPVLSGLIGVFVGAWLSSRQNQTQRKLDFCEKQLKEFYSPLVGIREEIRILSEFRCSAEKASEEWWQEVCKIADQMELSQRQKYYDEEGKGIGGQIEYDNVQLETKVLPAYPKLIEIFKNNYYLAEEETKKYFPILIKFIESWKRFLSKTHPRDVIKKINISEKELLPFYQHLEEKLKTLRGKLKEGKP